MLALDFLFLCLRVGELAFSATVAGITGDYLHKTHGASAWSRKRFIYTEIIAGIAILFSLLFLLPFTSGFLHYPGDLFLFAAWMIAFGLLVNFIGPQNCSSIWNWHGITGRSTCSKWKADIAFSFLASIFFLASALLGIYVTHKKRRAIVDGTASRKRWNRSRV